MSMIFPNTSKVLVDVGHGLSIWMHRVNSRNELRDLSDRELRDIGLCRTKTRWEGAKPFWMA
jgi:uncharacterized protein YjiS (DUF1127 family)